MSPDPSSVVSLDDVTVVYGKNEALSGVAVQFPPGAVGLLGPNGAGKSTMIKALLGFVVPTRGQMHVLGLDVRHKAQEIRARIGYMPENDAPHPRHERRHVRRVLRPALGPAAGATPCSVPTRCSTTSASARRATATSRPTRRA